MRRLSAIAVLALAALAAWPAHGGEPKLTSRNSLVAALPLTDSVTIDGVGCGVPASASLTLPAGAFDVQVRRPSPGARDGDAYLSGVSVQGNSAGLTAVADGAAVCDPAADSTPPAGRPWSARFDVEAAFRKRLAVVFWDANGSRARNFKARPREVRIGIVGAARRIRWKRFGARKAVGFGRFRSLIPCAGGCSDNGTRLSVELTRPGHCASFSRPGHIEDVVFYEKIAFVLRQRLGVLRRGREWMSTKRTCPLTGRPPTPVRSR